MNGNTFTVFYVVSLTVFSLSAADVFIINVKSPLSVERPLATPQELRDQKADEEKTLQVSLLSSNGKKSSDEKDLFSLHAASSRDLKTNVADLLTLLKANKNTRNITKKTPLDAQYRLFRNMYGVPGVPKKLKKFRKPQKSLSIDSSHSLRPFLKQILSNTAPILKHSFQHLNKFDSYNITEDYIDIGEMSRNKPIHRYSRDYIDFDNLRFRRNDYPIKPALRTVSVESNDDSLERPKTKAFDIIKNKLIHLVNDFIQDAFVEKETISSEPEEVKNMKNKRKRFKMKHNKKQKEVISMEDAATSLSSEKDSGTKEIVRPKSKKKQLKPAKNKVKHVSQANSEETAVYYLQGNKVYSPDEYNEDTRRRNFVNK